MSELISLDEFTVELGKKPNRKWRAKLVRQCQVFKHPVFLDFGRSAQVGCVELCLEDDYGKVIGMEYKTPEEPKEIFTEDLDSLATALEQADMETALKKIQCYYPQGILNIALRVIRTDPTMTLKVYRNLNLFPSRKEETINKILNCAQQEGWMEPNSNQNLTQKWKFLQPDNYLYAFLYVLKERDLIDDKNAFVRQLLSRRGTPFAQCLAIPKNETVKKDYYRIASDLVDSVG